MKTVTKKYVEYSIRNDRKSFSVEMENNDALFYLKNGEIDSFRFYEKEFSIDGNGKILNRSGWIYLGKRCTSQELKEWFEGVKKYKPAIWFTQTFNIPYVCLTKFGDVMIMRDGDMTLEELLVKYKGPKTI